MFLRNLEALKETLQDRATILIPTAAEPFKLLMGMPSLGSEGSAK